MSRPLRIEYEGAWYHIMNRGTARQAIYCNSEHKNMFLSLLQEISIKYFIEIHAYCLMDNHYHLLVHTPLPNLARAMRHLDGIYTQRFNISEKRDGPIFRGRYHSILIEEEQYLLQVSRYIHLNPISADLCSNPADYLWSSYQYYTKKHTLLPWLVRGIILNYFSSPRIEEYKNFVNQGIDEEIQKFYQQKPRSILGSNQFIENTLSNTTRAQQTFCQPCISRFKNTISIEKNIICINKLF